jgi:NAD+ synthase
MDAERQAQKLVVWIQEKVLAAGCQGVILGMSGGLDSSVVAVLCHRAFPQSTLGVIMPCHSIDADKAHALEVANQFDIPSREVVLDGVFDTLLQTLPDDKPEPSINQLIRANLKTRLRMVTLYYMARQLNYIVAGSSNRSEITIGYFTKYGDGGVDIMPLGNLVKGQVRELARFLGIPQPIIDKPPSAGLWEGQTDETEMGFSYETLDRYILEGEAPEEMKTKIEAMIAASQHKRLMPPIANFE